MKTELAVTRISRGVALRRSMQTSLPSRKSEAGNTLAEVVIATVILAIIAAALISSINYGMFAMRLARENSRATQIILEKLESIRLYDWYQVNSNGFVPTTFTN